ncbi:MAG: TonB family protein [Gammaproteobacteria bacterium]|nr:MAG: TonB family protein [Gammaproteobacteria bacterium]
MASAPSTASRSPEASTRAAGGASASLPVVDVTVVTSRDDFLLELGQALGGQAGVRPVESPDEALQSMAGSKRAQMLVIDARAVENVRAAVEAAEVRVPRAVILVFAEAAAEKQLAAALKGTSVFAVLPAEIEARKTQAVLEAAMAQAAQGKAGAALRAGAADVPLTIGAFRPRGASTDDEEGAQKPNLVLIGAAVAATAVVGGAFWYFMPGSGFSTRGAAPAAATHAAPPAAAAAAATDSPGGASAAASEALLVQGKVDDLLEKARLAMHERRYTEPAGDNALLYYRSAIAQDPHNGEALDGLSRVAGVLAGRVEDAISSGHLEEAALTLASFKSAAPNDLRSGPLEQRLSSAQMSKALTDGNFERAAALLRQAQQSGSSAPDQIARWRSDLARRQEEARVQRLAGLIADRIRDGKLTDAEDSAKIYLQQLESSAASSASTQRAVHDLSAAYLKKARDAAIAGNSTEQERWLNEARGLGMKPADIGALQRELAGARQKAVQADAERALRLARAALREGRLTDPGEGSAASYLSQLQSSDPANAALPDLGRELAARLLERARAAVLAGKSADADLAQAKRWGADPKDVQAVQQLGAPVAKTTVDTASLASSLKRLRASPPDYPPSALTQRITGNVTLEFTVSTSGEPRDVHVVEATPPGIFDQAAINAVKHWRYAPLLVNGAAMEVPVRTRMRFELPN